MTVAFDMSLLGDVSLLDSVEFGVGRDEAGGETFVFIPVDGPAKQALADMALATAAALRDIEGGPAEYSPSEKHSATEYLTVGLDTEHAARFASLHWSTLQIDANGLQDPNLIFVYFARFKDGDGNRLTCFRRAAQFKGVLKTRLVRFVNDTLKLVPDDVFKLDHDFDLMADSALLHILHPAGFELLGELQDAIMQAAPAHAIALGAEIPFVDVSAISAYASGHPRAARYLSSIRSQNRATNVDRDALIAACAQTGVAVTVDNGTIRVPRESVLDFLEVLDRRRYELELVLGSPEQYRAASRDLISRP